MEVQDKGIGVQKEFVNNAMLIEQIATLQQN